MTLKTTKIKLTTSVTIPLKDKFKINKMMKREPLFFHILLKQGMAWFLLLLKDHEVPI